MRAWLWLAALAACQSQGASGLPPAEQWTAASPAPVAEATPAATTNPHAMPHGQAPHGTIGTDVSKMGLPPPDPNRKIDLARHVRGVIRPAPLVEVADNTAVFVIAKQAGPDGKPSGPPLAVRRLTWSGKELAFSLSDANQMIAGTKLAGDVIVMAHYDQDGDALTKQPGDLIAQARVTVPADDVKLVVTPVD